jgi:hypothetical protein
MQENRKLNARIAKAKAFSSWVARKCDVRGAVEPVSSRDPNAIRTSRNRAKF